MIYFSTNDNDKTVAEAYKVRVEADNLKLYGMPSSYTPVEGALYADLALMTIAGVETAAQPVIGVPEQITIPAVGVVWSLPIRAWVMDNPTSASVSVWGIVVTLTPAARVLYLRKFAAPIVIPPNGTASFDLDLWFDTFRPAP